MSQDTTDYKAWALHYASLGWKVFPLSPRSKIPLAGSHGSSEATDDRAQIEAWWNAIPNANIGMNPKMSGLYVFDMDPRNGGDEGYAQLQRDQGMPLSPLRAVSGRGVGFHDYFAARPDAAYLGLPAKGCDGKFNGFVVLPPSTHPDTGERYTWVTDPGQPAWALPQAPAHLEKPVHERRNFVAREVSPAELPGIVEALCFLDAEDNDTWINTMASLKHWGDHAECEAEAYEAFCKWSATSGKPEHAGNEWEIEKRWNSWNSYLPNARTIASVFHQAKSLGHNPGPDAAAAFAAFADIIGHQRSVAAEVGSWTSKPVAACFEKLSALDLVSTHAAVFDGRPTQEIAADLLRVTGCNCDLVLEAFLCRPGITDTSELRSDISRALDSLMGHDVQPVNVPLAKPEEIFHRSQITWKKVGDEFLFKEAKGTAENLLRLAKAYDVRIRYNVMAHDLEVATGGKAMAGELAKNAQISFLEDLCRINGYPHAAVMSHMERLAMSDAYNPALDWVRSKPWDGVERITELFGCLKLSDVSHAALAYKLFRKWLVGAVALIADRTDKFEHALVLVDPLGGEGKTRFFNSWCPKAFQLDGETLVTNDKDSVLRVTSRWLVELGELDSTFKRSEIAALKGFLSKSEDVIRPPYARASNSYKRRTAFMGTVNQVEFLVDDTNNRRFWPIHVVGVNYSHTIDVQQVWAEALAAVEAGETHWLNKEENKGIAEYNAGFKSVEYIEETIRVLFDEGGTGQDWYTATQVLSAIGRGAPGRNEQVKCASILRSMNFETKKQQGLTWYKLPARNSNPL